MSSSASSSSRRLAVLASHLEPEQHEASLRFEATGAQAGSPKTADDIVIVCAVRTPVTRAKRGGLKDTPTEVLLATALKGILERTRIDPNLIDDVVVGNVLSAKTATLSRVAMLYAGYSEQASVSTINRQCSSGLQAVASGAAAISSGFANIVVAAGVESMSNDYGAHAFPSGIAEPMKSCKSAMDCLMPMGLTSENVAKQFGVTREDQDKFSALSHVKAAAAQKQGLFDSEIVPVKTTVIVDDKGTKQEVVISKDDGLRAETTAESLGKLKPAFKADGTTTAGNASQVSDGAAAVLLMKRSTAERLGLPVLARFITFAVAGCPPRIMGIGPAVAIPKALKQAGLTKDDCLYELNEAFASQALYCMRELGLNPEKVNVKGGAIALGHPLGCTGARQIATLLPEMKRRGEKYGCISMCIGSGMGAAAVIESEQ